jgi:lysozyme
MKMKTSQKGIDLIKKYEGLSLKPYLCPGRVMTIGYGTTRIDGHPVPNDLKITKSRAEELLKDDLVKFEDIVNALTPTLTLNQGQFDALVSFTYNLGGSALAGSTLYKKLKQNDIIGASEEFLRWNKAKGEVLEGLTKRRESERKLFTGKGEES